MRRWWVPGLAAYLARHPRDLPCVLRAAWRLRRHQWWRHRPWLPVPARDYWEFRLSTANGSTGQLDPAAVVAVARWSDLQRVGK